MSKVKLVYSLKDEFSSRIQSATSESELDAIASELGSHMKTSTDPDLKVIRQKIYDRKRKLRTSTSDVTYVQSDSVPDTYRSEDVNKIDIKSYVSFSVYLLCSLMTMFFIYIQSIPLYESVGFSDPKLCSLGAILMVVGFATIHSLTRSKVVLLLCLYASVYEVVLITSGTITDDNVQMLNSPELELLKEKSERSEAAYKEAKAKFDDPSSKMFQNAWYSSKFVEPAWESYSADKKAVIDKAAELTSNTKDSMLKILFRLGLVFLCMISVQNLLRSKVDLMRFIKKNP